MTKKKIEIQRHNVTPKQFFRYVEMRCKKKGLAMGIDFDDFIESYIFHNYTRSQDGSIYNEICEFTFDGERRGHGYYYQCHIDA